jgi:hypothetical protein
MKWALLAVFGILFLLIALRGVENFVDSEFTSGGVGVSTAVQRPCACPTSGVCGDSNCSAWESKVDAVAPSGAVSADYIGILAAFFDQVYDPATIKPTEAQVDAFLASSSGSKAGVDTPSVKRIIMDAFKIDESGTAASREAKSQNFVPDNVSLAPKMGRDEVRTRVEDKYTGANPNPSTRFSEGNYAPVTQSKPLNPGEWNDGSKNWKGPRPASVCACAENVM